MTGTMDPMPTSAPASAPALRRAPIQQRSAERLSRILDACATLLDEQGYEALSTRAVAQRAGVPIGSVYRFFSNKRELVDALAHRNLEEFTARISTSLEARATTGWREALDVMLDEYLAMKRDSPGFAIVDFGAPSTESTQANHRVAERLCALLAELLDRPATEALTRTCLVAVEASDALLQLAFRTTPSGDEALIAETRTLLHAYLAQTLDD